MRTLRLIPALIAGVLTLAPAAAWACGDKPCGSGSCPMAAHPMPASGDAAAVAQAPGTHAVLEISGMKCGNCSAKVQAALGKVEGVNASYVDHSTGKAEVAFDAARTNADALARLVTDLGYAAKVATR